MPVALPAEKSCFICCNGRSERGVAPLPCLLVFSTDKFFWQQKSVRNSHEFHHPSERNPGKWESCFNGIPFPSSPSQPKKNKDHTRHPTKRVGLAISGHGRHGACYAFFLGPAPAEELGKQPCFGYGAHGETERSSISRLGQATTTKSGHGGQAMMPLKVVF